MTEDNHASAAFMEVTVCREDVRQRGKGNQVVISPVRPIGQGTVTVTWGFHGGVVRAFWEVTLV